MKGALELDRDVVLVHGEDAAAYLQGQLSQDVATLPVGGSTFSLLLQPQGKVDAFLRITRTGETTFALDVDGGFGEQLVARLRRYLLRTRAEVEPVEWSVVAVRGTAAEGEAAPGSWRVPPETPGEEGYDELGPDAAVPDGVPRLDVADYERRRIELGVPRMGAELDERTIPAAAGIVDRTVSFTKGCYTGQELVARIDSRGGNVPTRLRRLATGDETVTRGATVVVDGAEVGVVTSAATGVALAYVKRQVVPPVDAVVRGDGIETPVRVEDLPT